MTIDQNGKDIGSLPFTIGRNNKSQNFIENIIDEKTFKFKEGDIIIGVGLTRNEMNEINIIPRTLEELKEVIQSQIQTMLKTNSYFSLNIDRPSPSQRNALSILQK